MDNANSMNIANEIRRQVGPRAFAMMGAKNLLGSEDSLQFKIGRNAKRVTHIRITLDPSDTYRVEFIRVGRAPMFKTTPVADFDGVYADSLHTLIEGNTGLYLSL
jgi:hypothetical protein